MTDTSAQPVDISGLDALAAELATLTDEDIQDEAMPVATRTVKANMFDTLDASGQIILQAVLVRVVGKQRQLVLPALSSFECNNANARTLQAWLRLRLADKGGSNIVVPVPFDTKTGKWKFTEFHIRPPQRDHGAEARAAKTAETA